MSTRAANTGAQGRVGFSPNATGATLPGGMGFDPNASTGSFDVNLNATNLQQTGSTQLGAVGKRGGDAAVGPRPVQAAGAGEFIFIVIHC